ncbi:unnamed protein product [Urochloa decumbens]|uniref:Uncharacterized protein n=1 Tax=Urochloa decumbens TaxID=240449 RepID=A0ABC9G0B0_9POAL
MAADDGCAKAALDEALKPFQERASEAEIRIVKLEALLYNQDGLNSGSEASSSAMKDLQSKLDSVSAEYLTEKEKVIKHFASNCRYLTTVNIYATTPCLMNFVEQEANHGEREAPVPHHPSYPCSKRGRIKIEEA